MMDNLFEVKTSGRRFIDLNGEEDLLEFARYFPENVIGIIDREENPAENFLSLNEDILIKEITWNSNG